MCSRKAEVHWRRRGHGGRELRGIAVLREPVVPCRGGVAVWCQCVECARETWPWASGCGVSPIPKEERVGAVDRAMARDACAANYSYDQTINPNGSLNDALMMISILIK